MKKILITAVILSACLFFSQAWAVQGFISGRVVRADNSAGTMEVALFRAGHHSHHHSPRQILAVVFPPGTLPDFVKKDRMVRMKGRFSQSARGQRFRALAFYPFAGTDNDPTGVRKRLLRHH